MTDPGPRSSAPTRRDRVRSALEQRRIWAPWAAALIVFSLALQTAPEVVDIQAVEGGLLPLVALAAAVPVGLILSRPELGWLIAAASAWVISRSFPVVDGDPWPWPIVHGLVILSSLFALAWRPSPKLRRAQRVIVIGGAWLATELLFLASVPGDLQAGWAVGVSALVVAGVLVRWLAGDIPPAPAPAGSGLPDDWQRELTRGFRTAFVDLVRSPHLGTPLRERYRENPRTWLLVLSAVPWAAAFGVFWIAMASVGETLEVHQLALPVLALAIALPVGLISDRVLLGWRLITVVAVVLAVVGTPSNGLDPGTWPIIVQFVWLGTTFLVSARHDRYTTIWVWLATLLVVSTGAHDDSGNALTLSIFATVLVFIGDLIRTRRQATRALEAQTELSELEKARRTILEERARIARDLHDVVAHHMSMVVVQAESAPYRIPDLSDEAKSELAAISTSARQALTEIRGLLGVLRNDDQQVERAPQPGLDDLPELVAAAARSGLAVTLADGEGAKPVPAATGLSAYRIVQESLANVARHAPGAQVRVGVTHAAAGLTIHVVNTAPPNATASSGTARRITPGHGIIGMRERAAVAGGTLIAESTADGGFAVTAEFPLPDEELP